MLTHPQTASNKRIPPGTITGCVPLEACKSYPTRYFTERNLPVTIAYADLNTKQELNALNIKVLPDGGKTAPHPQIVLYINGQYHLETLIYANSNAANWKTWIELHLNSNQIDPIINAFFKAKFALEKGF